MLAAIVALAHADGLMESGEAESEWQGGMGKNKRQAAHQVIVF